MEDIRKLLNDSEAATTPTQLAWTVRNLCSTLQEMLVRGPDGGPTEQDREYARLTAIADCAFLKASALANWLDKHEAECTTTD